MKRLLLVLLLVGSVLLSLGEARAEISTDDAIKFGVRFVFFSLGGTVIPTGIYHGLNRWFKPFREPRVKKLSLGNGRQLTMTFRMNEIVARSTLEVVGAIVNFIYFLKTKEEDEKCKVLVINLAIAWLSYYIGEAIHATVPVDNWASRRLQKITPQCLQKYSNHLPIYLLRSLVYCVGTWVDNRFKEDPEEMLHPLWNLLVGNIIGGWERKV